MQVCEIKTVVMQRNMDLIRELLLKLESDQHLDGRKWVQYEAPEELGITDHSAEEVGYHLSLLIQEGFVRGSVRTDIEVIPPVSMLTWQGHELLDNIRDAGIWGKTKERLKGLPSVAISIIGEVAKAEIKTRLGLP
ncbi:MAG TPA: DUF2513 domain-containing protein [Terriglobia bacterium]|nr:DUF2513 domain-containing protein [Terriglobia bacterium]